MSGGFVEIVTYPNRVQAEMAGGLLEEAGIPFIISSDMSAVLGGGIGSILAGGASLLVPESAREHARQVLESTGFLEEDDDGPPSAA